MGTLRKGTFTPSGVQNIALGAPGISPYAGQGAGHGLVGSFGSMSGDAHFGWGNNAAEEAGALAKALTAGSDINAPAFGPGVGFALRLENLSSALVTTLHSEKHFVFVKSLFDRKATNTIFESNIVSNYGGNVRANVNETELPPQQDTTYERLYGTIKHYGVTSGVSLAALLANRAHGPLIQQENRMRMLWLLANQERDAFFGDTNLDSTMPDGAILSMIKNYNSTLATDGNYTGWDDTTHAIDFRGNPLNPDDMHERTAEIFGEDSWGLADTLFCWPKNATDLSRQLLPKERFNIGSGDAKVGISVKQIETSFGNVDIKPAPFMTWSKRLKSTAADGDSAQRPDTPTISTAATTPADATNSRFGASDAGDYHYIVRAVNRYGHSAAVNVGTVTMAEDDKLSFGITPGSTVPTYYELYRTKIGVTSPTSSSTHYLIARIAYTGSPQTIEDWNRFLPDTQVALIMTMRPDVFRRVVLLPLARIPLALLQPQLRWMLLNMLAYEVLAPRRCMVLYNVGRL